jgi:hypothetical protein
MRLWFLRKKGKAYYQLYKIYGVLLISLYVFMDKKSFIVLSAIITILLIIVIKYYKRDFKKRSHGLNVEDDMASWLKNQLSLKGIPILTSVKMNYGDIDISIPSRNMVIDVKAYKKIDDRIYDDNLHRSLQRQIKYAMADVAVVWLPHARKEILRIGDNIVVVGGRWTLVNAIDSL